MFTKITVISDKSARLLTVVIVFARNAGHCLRQPQHTDQLRCSKPPVITNYIYNLGMNLELCNTGLCQKEPRAVLLVTFWNKF